jgi:hypothetical protein
MERQRGMERWLGESPPDHAGGLVPAVPPEVAVGSPLGGAPMATDVAVTTLEVSVPNTATCWPTVTLAMDGVVASWSRYLVELDTSTVTVVPSRVVIVKVLSPTDFTIPTAAGGLPPPGGRPGTAELEEVADEGAVVDAAAATEPPARTSPRATAAALVTRTPRRRGDTSAGEASPGSGVPGIGSLSVVMSLLLDRWMLPTSSIGHAGVSRLCPLPMGAEGQAAWQRQDAVPAMWPGW